MKHRGTEDTENQIIEQEETEGTECRFVLCCLCFLLFKMFPEEQEIGH